MQMYPSPSAIAADSGGPFYSSSSNPSNQHTSGLRNPDELQLTAQLTSGMSPILNSNSGSVGGGSTAAAAMAEVTDMRAQNSANLNHQYANEPDQHPHLQPDQIPMDHIGSHYGAPDTATAPRKRSKVSRACDECRRKKIRCDATGDPGDEQCSSCKRVGAHCQFSRVPMKRGPSKGYIKELADRLHTLEGAIHAGEIVGQYIPHHETTIQRRGSDEFSSPPPPPPPPPGSDQNSRKRPFSPTSEFGGYIPQRQPSSWNSGLPDAQRHLPPGATFASPKTTSAVTQIFRESNYSPNNLQIASWKSEPESLRRHSSINSSPGQEHDSPGRPLIFDSAILDEYYKLVQPTYSLLPYVKTKATMQFLNCPAPLRDAIHEAIAGAVRSFSKDTSCSEHANRRKSAQRTLMSSLEDTSSRPLRLNIIYLQTMFLLAIEAENQDMWRSQESNGNSHSVWLSNVVGLAYSIKLHRYPDIVHDQEQDADEKVARRIWWSLFIMDRWNAAGTSCPALIPDTASVLYPDDAALLGDGLWNLARLSAILGHISAINTVSTSLPPLSIPLVSAYGASIKGELERVRESLPPSYSQPLVLMAYWHLRILVELQLVNSEPNDLVTITENAISHLIKNSDLISPLRSHCLGLVTLALVDLLAYDSTTSKSEGQLNFVLENQLLPSNWEPTIRDMISQRKPPSVSTTVSNLATTDTDYKANIENLVRLADLATAAGGGRESHTACTENAETSTMYPSKSPFQYYGQLREHVRNGFLSVFKQATVCG